MSGPALIMVNGLASTNYDLVLACTVYRRTLCLKRHNICVHIRTHGVVVGVSQSLCACACMFSVSPVYCVLLKDRDRLFVCLLIAKTAELAH